MDTVTIEKQPPRVAVSSSRCDSSGAGFSASDRALVRLGRDLKDGGYRFTTITPASHGRINARPGKGAPSLIDIFGWSRPFRATNISAAHLNSLAEADALRQLPEGSYSSRVRFSTLGDQLFVHSSFPTEESDAVFFGPDTYRFCRLIRQTLATTKRRLRQPFRILDVGAGSGAGGLHAAALASDGRPLITLSDINRRALQFSRVNAALNAISNVEVVESDLFGHVGGRFDLIVANPPYLVDPLTRLYRHGGGELGSELSMRIVEQGLSRLNAGGRLILYTGSAIINGTDLFCEALSSRLLGRCVSFSYEEIDCDVFGEELDHPPYDRADRIAVVGVIITARSVPCA